MGRTFAISDIHGCFETFHNLVTRKIGLTKSDKLILLGDYIDRGEKSKEVIDFIIDLLETGFDVTPLAGNHEEMLVDSFSNPEMLPLWLLNSGMSTLQSFGIQDINDIEKKYLDFFVNLKYYETEGNFLFVHAGFNDFAPDPFSDKHGMIWECRTFYENPLLKGKTIIHGHRPKRQEYIKKLINENSKVIPIDTGCVYDKDQGYGVLSALDVGSMKLISVENSNAK
ncbi:MAG: serine/threonine protein phosphatase [Odoribacter sp.]|nr:serine/threonine protein phosphatase [Odoribacter sp.]